MPSIKPINDFVLVQREEPEKVTAGGIHIPETADSTKGGKAVRGRVCAVSDVEETGDRPKKRRISVGDVVLFGRYSGNEVDSLTLLIREDEIFGRVTFE